MLLSVQEEEGEQPLPLIVTSSPLGAPPLRIDGAAVSLCSRGPTRLTRPVEAVAASALAMHRGPLLWLHTVAVRRYKTLLTFLASPKWSLFDL